MSRMHRKPDGSYTQDDDEYVTAWKELGDKVVSFFPSYYVGGYDPGVLLHPVDQRNPHSFSLPMTACLDLAKKYDQK